MLFMACNSTKSNNENSKSAARGSNYHPLSKTEKLSDFDGKKVSFEGKISTIIMQHMMKGGPMPFGEEDDHEKEKHQYLSPLESYAFGEIVGYYFPSKVSWPKADKLIFYGTIGSISGAGKGGGTHTEYYIDLDKVEAAK